MKITAERRSATLALGALLLLGGCAEQRPARTANADDNSTREAAQQPSGTLARDTEADTGGLDVIKKRGTLRVIVVGGGEPFLPRQGTPMAYDRNLAEQLAARLGVKAVFVTVDSHDALLDMLEEGHGDIVAAQLTVTDSRRERVAFTRPVSTVAAWVVTSKNAKAPPKTVEELNGKEIHVRQSSSFFKTLQQIKEERKLAFDIVPVDEQLDTEALVYEVSQGKRPLTVVDSHWLESIETYNDDVRRLFTVADGRHIAWAVRKNTPQLKARADTFILEHALTGHIRETRRGDLQQMRERGVLRVLTRNNPVTYFLYRGAPMGFDYDLVAMLAEKLGLRLEMVVPPARDDLIPWLLEGRGDIIAASLTITPERQRQVAFSKPYLYVDEVIVQRRDGAKVNSLKELANQSVHVRPSSSFYETLKLLAKHHPVKIVTASEDIETEQLVGLVATGEVPLTVADSHVLELERTYRDNIEAGLNLSTIADTLSEGTTAAAAQGGHKSIAFAMRPDASELKKAVDAFVSSTYRGLAYNMARNRYFKNTGRFVSAKKNRTGVSGRLSPYDEMIKKYSEMYSLDWRLMAAQAYQESRFNPIARSWVGALGLFQVMPSTGKELGFDNLMNPEQSTHAGIKYMNYLIGRFHNRIPLRQRVRFALASYNVGYGHVQDARRLASAMNLDDKRWFGNVEKAMRLLDDPKYYSKARYGYCRGDEPVQYVSKIQDRYDNYTRVLKN